MSQDNVNELISALLDGELAPDEQARVEELLLDSAEHRRTFKEMRALRDHIQSLPRYTVDGDFTNSVLQQVEGRKRVPDASADAEVDCEQEPQELVATLPAYRDSSDSPRGMKRGLAWAAVAIAASVMIFLIYGPLNQRPHREAADVRDPSRGNEPSNEVAQDKSQLKDLDRAGLSQLPAKQFADSVEEDLERNADDRLLPGSHQPLVSSAKAADPNHLSEDFAAEKELAIQRLAAEAGNTDQPGLLPAGAFGGGAYDSGSVDLYYVVDIPSDTVASKIVDATLVENGIAMVDLQDQLATCRRTLGRSQIESTLDRFTDVDVRDSVTELSLQNGKKGELRKHLDKVGNSEILIVNATAQQIKETLASLKARGYQWESRQQLDSNAELMFEGKAGAGRKKQLNSPRSAVAESSDEQLDAKAASRGARAETANTNVPKDASKPEPALEEDAKRKLPRAPLPKELAGSASSNRSAIEPATTSKNEVGKTTDAEGDRSPSAYFAKSAGEKAKDNRQPSLRSFAYRLKTPAKQDSGGVLAREKKEESATDSPQGGAERPDSAIKDRANKSKPQPYPDAGGEGEPGQAVDGLDVAEAISAATENVPLVRAIIIFRSVPAAPKAEIRKATP